jgi:hypothetical protein
VLRQELRAATVQVDNQVVGFSSPAGASPAAVEANFVSHQPPADHRSGGCHRACCCWGPVTRSFTQPIRDLTTAAQATPRELEQQAGSLRKMS